MAKTLSELITDVRYRLDESKGNERWSDEELTSYINRRIIWLQSKIESYNSDYFIRIQNPIAEAGSFNMALPNDIMGKKIRTIRVFNGTSIDGEGFRVVPKPLEWVMAYRNESGIPEGYTIIDGYFEWAPKLQNDSIFRFVYAVRESTLTATGQSLQYIKDEFVDVVTDAAATDALIKTSDYGKISILNSTINDRLRDIANDIQPIDPIEIPQVKID